MDESGKNSELGTLRGADLVGYDPHDSTIHWFSIDNLGTAHDDVAVRDDGRRCLHSVVLRELAVRQGLPGGHELQLGGARSLPYRGQSCGRRVVEEELAGIFQ